MTWLLKLRQVPLLGWLVGIIVVLIASLIWSVKHVSLREQQLRVSMQLSSAKTSHEEALSKVDDGNKLARAQVRAIQAAAVGRLEAKRLEIRKAEEQSSERLSDLVNAMFRR
jgi:F0F1-type ATP synthase membrane subunit b/b'